MENSLFLISGRTKCIVANTAAIGRLEAFSGVIYRSITISALYSCEVNYCFLLTYYGQG
jgi:hypothetical protein